MKKLSFLLAFVAATLLASCSKQGSEADPPANFSVVAGDGSVTATWTAEPEVDYWIFYGPGDNITTSNWSTSGGAVIPNASSPRIITGLVNGRTYSFTINGRKDRGPGGPGAPTQVATPVLAGANWAPGTPIATTTLRSIVAGTLANGFDIVAVGEGGSIHSSVAGGAFTARTNPAAPIDLNTVVYGLSGFVAGGANGTILLSPDATAWTQQTSGTTATLYGGVSSAVGTYVLAGSGGTIVTGSNGTAWTTPGTGTTNDLYAAAFGALRFVVVGAAGTIISGTTASDWSPSPQLTQNALRGVAWAPIPGPDGVTAINRYVAVGDAGTVLTSDDGQSWTLQPPLTTANLLAIVNGGRFVAVGAGGVIFTSLDGVTWESRASGTTADLNAVVRQLSGYTAVGQAGVTVSTF